MPARMKKLKSLQFEISALKGCQRSLPITCATICLVQKKPLIMIRLSIFVHKASRSVLPGKEAAPSPACSCLDPHNLMKLGVSSWSTVLRLASTKKDLPRCLVSPKAQIRAPVTYNRGRLSSETTIYRMPH